jgi:hypothetical protein
MLFRNLIPALKHRAIVIKSRRDLSHSFSVENRGVTLYRLV